MITKIKGKLVELTASEAIVEIDALTYLILVPAADIPLLMNQIGNEVEFHTLHYYEGQSQGNSFIPRLLGFTDAADRSFFELFTTVKGIGNRKALRALVRPFTEIATAIANRDISALIELPEIGKRSAETIVAQLHGKVDPFVGEVISMIESTAPAFYGDAIEMLIQLGESTRDAKNLVKKVIEMQPEIGTADQIVQASFQLKGTT